MDDFNNLNENNENKQPDSNNTNQPQYQQPQNEQSQNQQGQYQQGQYQQGQYQQGQYQQNQYQQNPYQQPQSQQPQYSGESQYQQSQNQQNPYQQNQYQQNQQNPYQQGQYNYNQYPQGPKKYDNMALASLICGAASLILGCCLWKVTWIAAAAGLILGIMSLKKNVDDRTGKTMAIIGIILSGLTLLWAVFALICYITIGGSIYREIMDGVNSGNISY